MVDEMTRFEEEIGMPYIPPKMDPRSAANPQYVIRTNTFNQAQQNLMQGPETTMFVPNQVLNRPQTMPAQGSVNPAYSGNVNPYSQPIPPPPQPPSFAAPMIMRPETINRPTTTAPAVSNPPAHRPDPSFFPRSTTAAAAAPAVPESKPETNADGTPKVVLSATPKLYAPKIETYDYTIPVPSSTNYDYSKPTEYKKKNDPNKPDYIKKDGKQYALPSISPYDPVKKNKKQKKFIRVSGGQTWEDPTLSEWEDGDFRLFCGDLGNDVTDELLTRIFSRYPSFTKARVVRDKRTNKTKGFGFISFKDPQDFIKASKEMNGRYVGSRPIKLRKSTWKNRNLDSVKKKEKEKAALIALLTGKN